MEKQYDHEGRFEELWDKNKTAYIDRHVSAMTAESLHSKAAIATELGWRDAKIDEQAGAAAFRDQIVKYIKGLGSSVISPEIVEVILLAEEKSRKSPRRSSKED